MRSIPARFRACAPADGALRLAGGHFEPDAGRQDEGFQGLLRRLGNGCGNFPGRNDIHPLVGRDLRHRSTRLSGDAFGGSHDPAGGQ